MTAAQTRVPVHILMKYQKRKGSVRGRSIEFLLPFLKLFAQLPSRYSKQYKRDNNIFLSLPRLQDAAEARTLSEPDLLHYDINHRYLVQHPPPQPTHLHHARRHRSKTPTRLVVALYDYSPRHMSPNPNGHLDELPFRKGQLITVRAILVKSG